MKIGYGRVSKLDQDPQLQINALKISGCDKIFIEKISSRKEIRPEWVAANSHLREGDTLVAWKLDRLARTVLELEKLADDLIRRKIHLEIVTQKIDTSTPMGKLMFTMIAAFAEFERALIYERTTAGLLAAKEQGRTGGRPPSLDSKQKQVAEHLLKDVNIPVREIMKIVGCSKATFYRYFPGKRGVKEIESELEKE